MRRHREPIPDEKDLSIMREASRLSGNHVVNVDPEDPAQQLDDIGEFQIEPLEVEAQPSAEAEEDLDAAAAENVTGDSEPPDPDVHGEADREGEHETGELYGVRVPHAADTDLAAPEDQESFEGSWRGENWLESLEEHATEMGPAPEEEVVVIDDSDVEHPDHRGHNPTDWRDRPVADKGAGGPGGR